MLIGLQFGQDKCSDFNSLKEPYLGGALFQFPKICPTWLNTGPTWPHRAQPTSQKHLQISAVWAVPTREVGWMFIYLESHNPIFFGSNGLGHFVWSLRLWSSGTTCQVWELLRLFTAFFQQHVEKIRFCYGYSVRAATVFFGFFSAKIWKIRFCYR